MKPDFDLRQLEIFRKIVELGSFSRAADSVGLAQASVSERIEKLEAALGTRLLDRMGRRVLPTKAGDLLYRHALALLEMKRTACLEMEDFLGVRKGEISLGCSTIPGEYILPKILGSFGKRYPYVTVSLTIADSSEIESRVLEGYFEFGIIGSRSSVKTLLCSEIWEDELVLVVPASHPWGHRGSISVKELHQVPFLSRVPGSGTLKRLEEILQAAGAKGTESLRVVARFSSSTAVKEGIKAGLGVSILSSLALDTELKAGLLKKLKVRDLPMSRRFFLIQDRRRTASPLCKAFIEHLFSSLSFLPGSEIPL
ncbi:MAG: LysR family transcriptional regulator [Deltaproteobacteria bacterium]|nr:LysR family transcriptional regulator [Deltaproteobacteria bacterium]